MGMLPVAWRWFWEGQSLVADPGPVDIRVVEGGDPVDHAVLFVTQGANPPVVGTFPDIDAATAGAAYADGADRFQVPDTAFVEKVPSKQRADRANAGDVVRVRVVKGLGIQALYP